MPPIRDPSAQQFLDDLRDRDVAIMGDQVAIARVPAPTGAEEQRAEWVARRLSAAGLGRVAIDAVGNVTGYSPGPRGEAPVAICAHLDTVFDHRQAIDVRVEGNRYHAPGISDNARGIAVMMALADLAGSGRIPLSRPVLFAATTGEEGHGDLRGARYLFDTAAAGAASAVALDGPGDERVVNVALGCRRYHVAFRGPGGHSWGRYGSPNAVHAAAALVTRLTGYTSYDRGRTALTVSRIAGGTTINAIPAEAWIEVDVRSMSDGELARIDQYIRRAARDAGDEENARRRADAPPLTVTLTQTGDRPAGEVSARDAVVLAALEATTAIGRLPELAMASTDANIPISRGIPAVAIGGGGAGGETHTQAEWFENRDGVRGVARAAMIVSRLSSLA